MELHDQASADLITLFSEVPYVVARGDNQGRSRAHVRGDMLTEKLGLVLVGHEQEYNVTPGCSFSDGEDAKSVRAGRIFVGIIAVADDDLANAAVTQVFSLRCSLVAVADEGKAFVLYNREVGVAIIVDRYTHWDISWRNGSATSSASRWTILSG